jgi:hypothetical protein
MSATTNKGSGSFCIPNHAIQLLSNPEIETEVIGTFLVIAMCTGPDGVTSSAGIQAIEKFLKCGKAFAERQVAELVRIGVIEDLRANLGVDKSRRAAVRFLVCDFDEPLEDRVWFDRSFVEYTDSKTKESNIYSLCQMRPECIRVLLWMYANMHVGSTTVQHPIPAACIPGMMVRYKWDKDQTRRLASHEIRVACFPEFDLQGCDLFQSYSYLALDKAVEALYRKGFVYEVIMVWDQPLNLYPAHANDLPYLSVDAKPQYQLHVRKCHGKLSDDEVGVSHLTLKASKSADVSVFHHEGVLENKYVVISKPGRPIGVAGVFRLSHRVKNPRNLGIKEAWASLMDSERAYRKWLAHTLEDAYQLDLENLGQTIQFEAKTQRVLDRRPQPRLVTFRSGR